MGKTNFHKRDVDLETTPDKQVTFFDQHVDEGWVIQWVLTKDGWVARNDSMKPDCPIVYRTGEHTIPTDNHREIAMELALAAIGPRMRAFARAGRDPSHAEKMCKAFAKKMKKSLDKEVKL